MLLHGERFYTYYYDARLRNVASKSLEFLHVILVIGVSSLSLMRSLVYLLFYLSSCFVSSSF